MTAFEKMKLREGVSGATPREEWAIGSRAAFEALLPDGPSYKTGVEVLGKGPADLRMDNRKLAQGTTPQMDIHAPLGGDALFALGDVLRYQGGYWLCIEAVDFHGIQRDGKVEECNYFLRWQNPVTLEVVGRWCSVRDPYASGLDDGRVVTTGNAKYRIKMPHDGETALFHVDKRFLIDIANNEPIPYAIVKYDAVTNRYASRSEGFLVVTLRESQLGPGDDHALMVADYQPAPPPPRPPIGLCEIRHGGAPAVKAGGMAKVFSAVFYGHGGEEAGGGLAPAWEVVLPPGLQAGDMVTWAQDGHSLAVLADARAAVGAVFTLRVRADHFMFGYFESSLDVEVVGLV